jgi:hypothetical protein
MLCSGAFFCLLFKPRSDLERVLTFYRLNLFRIYEHVQSDEQATFYLKLKKGWLFSIITVLEFIAQYIIASFCKKQNSRRLHLAGD